MHTSCISQNIFYLELGFDIPPSFVLHAFHVCCTTSTLTKLDLWFCSSQEPEVQQKQTDQAEAPQEQPASQLATPGASVSEDATASTALDMSQQDSQAQMAMPGQAETEPASRAESIATPPLVSAAPDISGGEAEPSTTAEQATTACDTVDVDTDPSVSSTSGDQQRQQSACQPADSIHTNSLDDADKSPTVLSLQAEPVDQQQQQVSTTPMLQTPVLLAESTAADTDTILHLQQKQQQQHLQVPLAEQPEATAEPAKAKQINGGPAVQQQQASTDELTEPAAATCDKVDKSAMAGSPADAQSRASSATARAFTEADAGPSGHGGQLEVKHSGFNVVHVRYQCLLSRRPTKFCPVRMPAKHFLLLFGNMHCLTNSQTVSTRVFKSRRTLAVKQALVRRWFSGCIRSPTYCILGLFFNQCQGVVFSF